MLKIIATLILALVAQSPMQPGRNTGFVTTGGGGCSAPSYSHIYASSNPSNTCGGGVTCTNGAGVRVNVDSVAASNATQTTTADQPGFSTSATINSLPTIIYTEPTISFLSITSVGTVSGNISGYFIGKLNSAFGAVLGGSSTGALEWRIDASTGKQQILSEGVAAIAEANTALSTSVPVAFGFEYNASTGAYTFFNYSGGTAHSDGSGTATPVTFTANTDTLGYASAVADQLAANMAEIGIFNGIGNTGVATWVNCKYGI